MTYEEVKQLPVLFLKNYKHKEQSLKSFIRNFLLDYNLKYDTYNSDGLTCNNYKSRSLGDIYRIAKNYYPSCTIEEVKDILISFGRNLVGHFCTDINKRVYQHKKVKSWWNQGSEEMWDEFGELIRYKTTPEEEEEV